MKKNWLYLCGARDYFIKSSPTTNQNYDMVIDACNRKDTLKVCEVITGLIDSLNLDYPEIAKSLLRLYEYCMDEVKSVKFDIPLKILKELREPWVQAQGRVQSDIPQSCSL